MNRESVNAGRGNLTLRPPPGILPVRPEPGEVFKGMGDGSSPPGRPPPPGRPAGRRGNPYLRVPGCRHRTEQDRHAPVEPVDRSVPPAVPGGGAGDPPRGRAARGPRCHLLAACGGSSRERGPVGPARLPGTGDRARGRTGRPRPGLGRALDHPDPAVLEPPRARGTPGRPGRSFLSVLPRLPDRLAVRRRVRGIPGPVPGLGGLRPGSGRHAALRVRRPVGPLLRGHPAVAGAIFHTSIRLSQDAHGRPFYAPTSPPEVPGSLAAAGEYVDGLSSYPRYLIGTDGAGAAAHPTLRPLAHRSASVDGYPAPVTLAGVQEQFASDYQVAYDQLSLYQQFGYPTDAVAATILWSGNYTGATVTTPYGTLTNNEAVGPFDPNDVDTYYNETLPTGEPHPTVYGAPLDGAPLPGPLASWDTTGSAFENTLDLEDLGALAPGATIYNVYAPWASYAGLDQAFAYVLSPNATTPALANVSVISNSWGSPEINDTGWYQDLQEAQVRGITVLAISGDSGDSPASSWGVGDAFYPGSMAYDNFGDVAVGGTTNTLSTTTLSLLHQRAWYDGSQPGGPVGSTGGVSGAFSEPSWQSSTSAGAVIGGAGRGVPDVAALANNSLMTFTIDGYQYQATNASVNSNYYYSWGTSIATPVEAGVVADIDHVLRAPSNRWMNRPLGFFDPSMYRLASEEDASLVSNSTVGYFTGPSYASRLPTLPLTDVTTGGNDRYAASTGYDLVTGWGAIDAYNLTMYYLALPGNSTPGQWEAVRASMNLTDLVVTSSYPGYGINTAYNASIQQNFFVANSLGAPVYWVQNVVYIYGVPGDWQMNFTGWLVYPFYGVEGTLTMFEYNVPIRGVTETPPVNFTLTTQLTLGADFDQQEVQYSFGTPGAPTLTLPIPGAAYIIGNLSYNYSWQGVEYSDGPYPAPYGGPGGLAPQFGLVGGPSGFIGNFGPGTAGSVQLSFSWGGPFLPGLTRSFGASIDQ